MITNNNFGASSSSNSSTDCGVGSTVFAVTIPRCLSDYFAFILSSFGPRDSTANLGSLPSNLTPSSPTYGLYTTSFYSCNFRKLYLIAI